MISLLPVILTWIADESVVRELQTTISGSVTINYNINSTFCTSVLPFFREDTFLSWKRMTCDDVNAAVRRSFDGWQYNSMLSFREVRRVEDSHISITASNIDVERRIAQATQGFGRVSIETNDDVCWYTDHHFCTMAERYRVFSYTFLAIMWVLSIFTIILLLLNKINQKLLFVRLFAWTVFGVCPMVFLGALLPCQYCFDFVQVMMHEVGHAIGLQHPNDESLTGHKCGCGTESISCEANKDPSLIMYGFATYAQQACLGRDDVDAVRTLYGGICADPGWCYDRATFDGLSRVAIAFVYSFLVAFLFVSFRNCFDRRNNKPKKRRTILELPTVASSQIPRHSTLPPPPPPRPQTFASRGSRPSRGRDRI